MGRKSGNNGSGGWYVCVPCTKRDPEGTEVRHPVAMFKGGGDQDHWTRTEKRKREHGKWESKNTLRHVGTKLMCPDCTQMSGEPTVKQVVDFKPLSKLAVLECRHERPVTLPSSMTSLSLTPEERQAAEKCMDAGCTSEALATLEQELLDNMLRQMERENEIVGVGAVDGD